MRDLVDDLASLITDVIEDFPDVEPLDSPIPEVKKDDLIITNKMSKCPPLRKMHLELANLNGLKILHSVFFPNPHYNLPIFGCDIVATDKTVTAAIVDVSPVKGFEDWDKIREISNAFEFSETRHIPAWGDEVFSPYAKFMRLSKDKDISKNDISYKYMPISIFDVQKMGKKGLPILLLLLLFQKLIHFS